MAFRDLDLLRPRRLDPRPVALLDEAAHPHAAALERSRRQPGGDEATLVSFRDGHRQPLRPSSPEIHVDDAAALADGPYFAFHHRETAALGDELRQGLGPDHGIIRFGPKAKLGLSRRPLAGKKLVGARAFPGLRGDARETTRQPLVR